MDTEKMVSILRLGIRDAATDQMCHDAADMLERQEAEIERLRARLDAVSTEEWDRIIRERDEAFAEIERLRKEVTLAKEARTTNFQTNLTLMCDLKQAMREREEAREAARRLVTVLANGDASVIERAIEEYPWLKEEDDE